MTGVALTKANVLAEVEKVFASIPEDVMAMGLENGSLNIYVSYSAYMKVKMALGDIWGDNVVVTKLCGRGRLGALYGRGDCSCERVGR